MRVEVRVRRTASVVALWLLITAHTAAHAASYAAAQAGAAPNSAASKPDAQSQGDLLHGDLQRASEAMHKGELTSAEQALRHALTIDPHSIVALNNLGIVLARQGKPAEAIPFYEEALKVEPSPTTKRNLAIAYFKAQRYAPAWQVLQPLAVSYPTDFQILDLAGLSLFALDRYPEAATYLERANQAQPSDMETLDMLGKAYLRMKDFKALTGVFARIMQLNPNSASAHFMMATAYDQMSNRVDAIKEYQAAVAADTTFMGAHSGLGFEYWRERQNDLAEKEFRTELKRFPSDPVANCILGQILLEQSKPAEAASLLRAALAVNPRYAEALFALGKAELELKHPRAAVDPLRKAVEIDPNYYQAHYVLGNALRQMGRTAEADAEQQTAVDIQEKEREKAIKRNESQ